MSTVPASSSALCPWLVEARLGTWIARGRARFPEGVTPPTTTPGGEYLTGRGGETERVPPGAIVWSGESFEIRYEGVRKSIIETLEGDILYAMCEGGTRPVDAHGNRNGEFVSRLDSMTWEAPSEPEQRLNLTGTVGYLFCDAGIPVSVDFEDASPEDFESIAPAFRAVFAGVATLGPWELTPGKKPGFFSGIAEVEWHGPGRSPALVETVERTTTAPPLLFDSRYGDVIVEGFARFPAGVALPTTGDDNTTIKWDGERFTARLPVGLELDELGFARDVVIDALRGADPRVVYRITDARWQAHAGGEAQTPSAGDVEFGPDGKPVAVTCPEAEKGLVKEHLAGIFGPGLEVGAWQPVDGGHAYPEARATLRLADGV